MLITTVYKRHAGGTQVPRSIRDIPGHMGLNGLGELSKLYLYGMLSIGIRRSALPWVSIDQECAPSIRLLKVAQKGAMTPGNTPYNRCECNRDAVRGMSEDPFDDLIVGEQVQTGPALNTGSNTVTCIE